MTVGVNKTRFTQQHLMKRLKLHKDRQSRTFGCCMLSIQHILFILMRDGVYRSRFMTLLQRYFINIASQHS